MSKIKPCLWFNGEAEDAANFYVALFPDSRLDEIGRYGEGMPFPAGTALMVEFTLAGQGFQALNGGPQFKHSEAISLSITVADQAELDHYWHGLIADTGSPSMCGWLKDKYGVSWQVVPRALVDLQKAGGAGVGRMMQKMMTMKKLDIAALEAAFVGGGD
jgi:predicted 3-demethylubiquinone-9 3-methyltransferase (glyoxalase superfamily)